MRGRDQPAGVEPRAAQLLPGLPNLNGIPLAGPPCRFGPLPRPNSPVGFDLNRGPRGRQPRLLRSAPAGQVLRDGLQQALGGKRDLVHGPLAPHLALARRLAKPPHLPPPLAPPTAVLLST